MGSALDTLAAIVDGFVPSAEGLPSASELGVHRRLLAEVDALGRPALRRQLDLLLRVADTRLGSLALTGMPVPFSQLDQPGRETWLRRLGGSSLPAKRMAFQDLKRLTLLIAYGMEDSPWRARTGYAPPVAEPPLRAPLDVRTPAPGETIEADVAVIGSGPGGALTAAVLAAAGKSVVILERAAYTPEDRLGGPELAGLGDLFLDRGLAATTDRWISIRAGSAVGGGSVVYWASSFRAPDEVREEWRSAGIDDDLDAHYDAVEAIVSVNEANSARNGPNSKLAVGLDALGIPWRVIPRAAVGCGDCGPCAVGCRSGAKQGALQTTLPAACANGARILDRTTVRRILVDRGRAVGVEAAVPGGTITVRARQVALAGGSILSPSVLQRSGIAEGTAGRGLHLHPVVAVAGIYPEPMAPWSGVPQSVMSDAFGRAAGAWGFRLEAAPTHPGLIATGFPWWSSEGHRATLARAGRVAAFLAIVRDRTEGRVDLARDGSVAIRYAPGRIERNLIARAAVELSRAHHAAGADEIMPLETPPHTWRSGTPFEPWLAAQGRRPVAPNRVLLFTAHQMSSCRIGRDPRTSVAAPDGQVHGVRGLYVTDASALPTATGVNPMLSILAVAHRTAGAMAAGG